MFYSIFTFVGKPNVGKSSIINTLIKKKINITSKKKFTTQNYNLFIKNEFNYQFIYIDTPGIEFINYNVKNKFFPIINLIKNKSNVILFVINLNNFDIYDKIIFNYIKSKKNLILLINKIDLLKNKNKVLNLNNYIDIKYFKYILEISSFKKKNILKLKNILLNFFKKKYFFFNKNYFLNKNFEKICIDTLKEKFFRFFNKEIPYNIIFKLRKIIYLNNLYKIYLNIIFNKISYKKILLGNINKILKIIIKLTQTYLESIFNKKFLIYLRFNFKKQE